MPDEILERALKREGELKAELEEIRTFIRVYSRMFRGGGFNQSHIESGGMVSERGTGLESIPSSVFSNIEVPKSKRRTRSASSKNAVIEAAKRILKNRTEPIKNAEISRMILSEGVNVNNDNKERYISTVLSHCDDFRAAPHRAGWLLKDASLRQTDLMRYNPNNMQADALDVPSITTQGEQNIDNNSE